jgi:uncharacterized protein (DUF924 family)
MFRTHPSSGIEPEWATEVLPFWFEEPEVVAHWFRKGEDIDGRIRDRFLALYERIMAHAEAVPMALRPLLAAVIVLDQFSRHLFRGTARAFEADPVARRLARTAIERRLDVAMNDQERLFIYLPFQHSEALEDQALGVELIARLGNEEWTGDAIEHKEIIVRFGRFPHRNAVLNRQSSADELALLRQPKNWF